MATFKNVRFTTGQEIELAATSRGLVEKSTERPVTGLPKGASGLVHDLWMEVFDDRRKAPTLTIRAEVTEDTFRGGLVVRLLNLEEYLAS